MNRAEVVILAIVFVTGTALGGVYYSVSPDILNRSIATVVFSFGVAFLLLLFAQGR